MALIYADTVKLRNINCVISTENRRDNFFAPHPALLTTKSSLGDTGRVGGLTVRASLGILLSLSCLKFFHFLLRDREGIEIVT